MEQKVTSLISLPEKVNILCLTCPWAITALNGLTVVNCHLLSDPESALLYQHSNAQTGYCGKTGRVSVVQPRIPHPSVTTC